MTAVLARNWWAVALRGLVAVLFGLAAFVWPGLTIAVLILLFGAYAFVDGVFAIVEAIRAVERKTRWWPLLLEGIVGIIAGLVAFFYPGLTALALLYLIAAWALITGVFEIIAAIQLRHEISNEWLLGLSGLASLIFGIILIASPGAGALALIWVIGAYAVIFGLLLFGLAYRLYHLEQEGRARVMEPT